MRLISLNGAVNTFIFSKVYNQVTGRMKNNAYLFAYGVTKNWSFSISNVTFNNIKKIYG